MRAEIIAIGDELTSGQRLDTNSQWLSERLGELGVRDEGSGLVEIVSGLDTGTEIVRTNLGTLRSGSQVRRVKA